MKKPATGPRVSEEFTRFRDLAKCLVAVPKKEIENKKIQYDLKKTKAKRPAK
jgi:hypothetical protein